MHLLTMLGIALGGGTIAVDHLLVKLPDWLAITLFSAAWVLIIVGMLLRRKNASNL